MTPAAEGDFRKSSFSFANGNCVEVGWRKASFSNSGGCLEAASSPPGWRKADASIGNGACAEVGSTPGLVLVRDTTDRGGVTLAFGTGAWREFTARLAGDGAS